MDDSAPAVDETKMDVAMMEGVPEVMDEGMPMASAPSVALSGSAKMGLKREDDNASMDPESDNIKTVVEYEIKFSSSGVTDGGLVFGAAISIDEDGKGAAGSNGVNAASVHIGGADGTWKLQFGGNDPSIDLVGNIGVANADDISGMTKTLLPLTFTHGSDTRRVHLSETLSATNKGKTLTSALEGPLPAISVLYYANGVRIALNNRPISHIKQKKVDGAIKYVFISPSPGNNNGLRYSITGSNMPAPPPGGHTAMALTGTIESFSYALTASEAGEDTWSAGVKYDPGPFYISAGMDYNDVLAIGAGGTFSGFTGKATYVKQSGKTYWSWISVPVGNQTAGYAKKQTVNEMEAYGLSVSRDIGAATNVTLAYSRLTNKGLKPTFVGTKQWELDFTYDLGGGASFYAGIEQANKSTFTNKFNSKVSDTADVGARYSATHTPIVKKSKVTTLEAGITMQF